MRDCYEWATAIQAAYRGRSARKRTGGVLAEAAQLRELMADLVRYVPTPSVQFLLARPRLHARRNFTVPATGGAGEGRYVKYV